MMVFGRFGRLLTSAAAMLLAAAGLGADAQSAAKFSCESPVGPSYMAPEPGWNTMRCL